MLWKILVILYSYYLTKSSIFKKISSQSLDLLLSDRQISLLPKLGFTSWPIYPVSRSVRAILEPLSLSDEIDTFSLIFVPAVLDFPSKAFNIFIFVLFFTFLLFHPQRWFTLLIFRYFLSPLDVLYL
jgi:hypothetical protein